MPNNQLSTKSAVVLKDKSNELGIFNSIFFSLSCPLKLCLPKQYYSEVCELGLVSQP